MNILTLPINSLVPYENNSKRHPQEQIEAIAKSIQSFGFDQPIVVDKNNVIIKGHGRWFAAKFLGYTEVPVVRRDDISENDAKFLRESDNQVQSVEWDTENLASELNELKDLGKLEFTLFIEDNIPALPQFTVNLKQEEFDLSTKHTCGKCQYVW